MGPEEKGVPVRKKKYEELELEDGTLVRCRRHENGGGMVAMRAAVDPSARIEENAWVDQDATVGADARLGASCWVEPGARIGAAPTWRPPSGWARARSWVSGP